MPYADLHCHPSLYAFNRLRNSPDERDPDVFNPWHVPEDVDHQAMQAGSRGATYTQCTMPMLAESGTRLVFASITPIERGFFVGSEEPADETSFTIELAKLATGTTLLSSAALFLSGRRHEAGAAAAGMLRNRGPARRLLQRAFLRYSPERIRYMQSHTFDYWDEFERELEFFRNADGQQTSGELVRPNGRRDTISGRYDLIRDGEHLDAVLNTPADVAAVLTIEGAHTFSVGPDGNRVPDEVLMARVDALRAMPERILFVTLAHHFDNGLCGHARSLPDAASWVMDQTPRIEDDLDPIGLRVVRELLDLDEALEPRGGRRILIDCKHMSPQARKTYYARVIGPYNEKARQQGRPTIPVVHSHTAYNGVKTLDELIANADRQNDHWHRPPYLAWGINVCDEDVRVVWQSGGLLGIVFDQRVCGVAPRQKIAPEAWVRLFVSHVFAMVDAVWQDERLPREQRIGIWDCICLGTDFDGMIDPFSQYPTVLHFDRFRRDLVDVLTERAHTRGITEIGPAELADKLLWRNAHEFARREI